MAIRINAAILDAIDRVLFLVEHQEEIPNKTKTLEYCLEDVSAAQVKGILLQHDIDNCHFSDNSLFVTVPLSADEITAQIKDLKDGIDYWVGRLVKWSDTSEEFKIQISQYLQKHSAKYAVVAEMIKNYARG